MIGTMKGRRRNYFKYLLVFALMFLVSGPFVPLNLVYAQAPVWTGSAQLSGNQLQLNWNAVANATGYKIYRTTDQPGEFHKLIATIQDGTAVSYTDATIAENVLYHYEITSLINGTESALSNALTVWTTDMTNPSPVTIQSSIQGPNWIEISWEQPANANDIHHYEIFRNGVKIGVTDGTVLSYRDVGVSASTSYSYHVVSVDRKGNRSVNSNTFSAATTAGISGVKLNEDFAGAAEWTNNNVNWLTFNTGKARWYRSGNQLANATANADLLSSYAINITSAEAGQTATLTFDWYKAWSNADNRSGQGQNHDLYVYYKEVNAGSWTQVWSELTEYQNQAGVASINITFPTAGNYQLRFRGDLATSDRGSDTTTLEVDNVKLEFPNPVPATPALNAPSTSDNAKISLSWSGNTESDFVGYKILRSVNGDVDANYVTLATSFSNSFTDPDTAPGQTYYYKVAAIDNQGAESARSNPVQFTTAAAADTTPPNPATDLTSDLVSASKINLVWTASPSSDLSQYVVWKSDDGVTYVNIGTTTVPSFEVNTGLAPARSYSFRVMAKDSAGNYSQGSNVYSVTTPAADTQKPTAPTAFKAETIAESYVEFSWGPSTDNVQVDRYEIQMLEGNTFVTKKTLKHPSTTGVVDGLNPNVNYSFQLIAFDTSGNPSDPTSPPLSVTTLQDVTPPKVLLKKPYDGSSGIGTGEAIFVRFDDEIDPATVNDASFYVVKDGDPLNSHIAGTFNLSNPKEIRFNPSSLSTNTKYKVTMENTIRNKAGLSLEQTHIWYFTTGISQYTKPHGNYVDNTEGCKNCHNSHTGERPRLLNQKQVFQVCYTCHDGTGATGNGSIFNIGQQFGSPTAKSSHHPVYSASSEEGVQINCSNCHNPHDAGKDLDTGVSKHWNRLLSSANKTGVIDNSGKEFCWNCHGKTASPDESMGYLDDYDKTGNHRLVQTQVEVRKSATSPIKITVNEYRTDHQTYFPNNNFGHNSSKMDEYKWYNGATTDRQDTGTGIKCVACHEKHGSSLKPLLRTQISWKTDPLPAAIDKNGKEFCYQCHQQPITFGYSDWATESNQNAWDGKDINEARGHAQFDCQVCHNPHGSPYPNYLRLPYRVNTANWQNYSYNPSDFALCFDCHDENKLRTKGASLWGYPGRGNYHDFHLTDTKVRASCKNCHRPHGATSGENPNGKVNHRVGFPALGSEITGKQYFRDGAGGLTNGGTCSLNCHGRSHRSFGYGGALRNSGNADNWALKDNWKTESWLLNNRPDAYKNGNGTHYRDTGNDGFWWK
ncbi:cytochrome c3 family protein [Effusibacillus lacus]|nr:cytochrome c3 family protein [Effusibacillus lacus]